MGHLWGRKILPLLTFLSILLESVPSVTTFTAPSPYFECQALYFAIESKLTLVSNVYHASLLCLPWYESKAGSALTVIITIIIIIIITRVITPVSADFSPQLTLMVTRQTWRHLASQWEASIKVTWSVLTNERPDASHRVHMAHVLARSVWRKSVTGSDFSHNAIKWRIVRGERETIRNLRNTIPCA